MAVFSVVLPHTQNVSTLTACTTPTKLVRLAHVKMASNVVMSRRAKKKKKGKKQGMQHKPQADLGTDTGRHIKQPKQELMHLPHHHPIGTSLIVLPAATVCLRWIQALTMTMSPTTLMLGGPPHSVAGERMPFQKKWHGGSVNGSHASTHSRHRDSP